MHRYIIFFICVIVCTEVTSISMNDVISFNTDVNVGYEGFVDSKTRVVETKTQIKAWATRISASRKICGFRLWSSSSLGRSLPFMVRMYKDAAILITKPGADLDTIKSPIKFFIQAVDCDPIKHASVKVPVTVTVIPGDRPVWSEKVYSFSVSEGKPAGHFVGQVMATEHGSNNSICNYVIERPEDAPFDVQGNGRILTRKELHVYDVRNYILRVRADDCYRPRARSSLVSVNIEVSPVCRPGWQGVFEQLNYRAGNGPRHMFHDSRLKLILSCSSSSIVSSPLHVDVRLEAGDRKSCPRPDGCPLTGGEQLVQTNSKAKAKTTKFSFDAKSVKEAETQLSKRLVYLNSDVDPTPCKRRVVISTRLQNSESKEKIPDTEVVIVLRPRPVPILHPNLGGSQTSASVAVTDSMLAGPGFPVLHDLHMVLEDDRAAGKAEPVVTFCLLRIHPKLTPVAYMEIPKQAVRQANLNIHNDSNQLNLLGEAPSSVYRGILRRMRYHHAYPYALNSTSFVLICRERNTPNSRDSRNAGMLVIKLRIHHVAGVRPTVPVARKEVPATLHDPPPLVMKERAMPGFPEAGVPNGHSLGVEMKAQSAARHHEEALGPHRVTSTGTWSAGAVVGFVLGLIFLSLATYLAVMRYRRYRSSLAGGAATTGEGGDGRGHARFGVMRGDSAERHNSASGLEMEWDNSELNITVNPMEESFTKYSQVVHYREFSSDEEAEDDEDMSSLLSGIPEEGEEESSRSCGSGSYGGVAVGLGGGLEDEDWQWEDDMLPAYTHRPSSLGSSCSAHV